MQHMCCSISLKLLQFGQYASVIKPRLCLKRPISQIPQCSSPISHNASFCNRNVHISVTKWCIMGYGTDACGICARGLVWCMTNCGIFIEVRYVKCFDIHIILLGCCFSSGGHFKNTYELLNLRALEYSPMNKIHIFQCMGAIFCAEFQRYPLKFHTKYLTHTLKDMIFIQHGNFKSF